MVRQKVQKRRWSEKEGERKAEMGTWRPSDFFFGCFFFFLIDKEKEGQRKKWRWKKLLKNCGKILIFCHFLPPGSSPWEEGDETRVVVSFFGSKRRLLLRNSHFNFFILGGEKNGFS